MIIRLDQIHGLPFDKGGAGGFFFTSVLPMVPLSTYRGLISH